MAEIEIHHEHGHDEDPLSKRVGLMVGLIGVTLAAVTIMAHRQHTAAVMHRAEANDEWSYFQAKKIREHTDDAALQVLSALSTDPARAEAAVKKLEESRAKYKADAEAKQKDAEGREHETERAEMLALRFDLGEGLLELGLVMSSLYFLGRQKGFPLAGGLAAAIGIAIAASALLL